MCTIEYADLNCKKIECCISIQILADVLSIMDNTKYAYTYFILRAIDENDGEKDVVEEMKKILQLLQGHEEPKAEGVKSSKGGRRSTTPDEK